MPAIEYWHRLDNNIELLLRLRAMGAEGLVTICADPDAHRSDPAPDDALVTQLAERLLEEADFDFVTHRHDPRSYIRVTHPGLDQYFSVDINPDATHQDSLKFAATVVARRIAGSLVHDLRYAQSVRAPVAVAPAYGVLSGAKPTLNDVLLQLELPVLDGLTPTELQQVRHDEGAAFRRLKVAVRKAIQELIRNRTEGTAQAIALEVRRDLIEPELDHVRERLRLAEEALNQKQITAVGMGSVLTVCGLLTGLAPVALAGIGFAAGGLVVPEQQHIDKLKDIELSDMFFLWKASTAELHH